MTEEPSRYPGLGRLLDTLAGAGFDVDPIDVADACWLAAAMPQAPAPSTPAPDDAPALDAPAAELAPPDPTPGSRAPAPSTAPPADPASMHRPLYATHPAARSGRAFVELPDAPALAQKPKLLRALRPLRRRVSGRLSAQIDELATARQTAARRLAWPDAPIAPVFRPTRERWLDAVLLIDRSQTMALWRRTLEEWALLLQRLGAFRDLRIRYLVEDDAGPALEVLGTGSTQHPPSPLNELVATAGRGVVMVASDCIGPLWSAPAFLDWLSRQADAGPLAILQVLPPHLWPRTALAALPPLELTSVIPGQPTSKLPALPLDPELPDSTGAQLTAAIPVVPLRADALAAWAHLVAGASAGRAIGFRFAGEPSHATASKPPSRPAASALVDRFLSGNSATARKLAAYLAAVPLTAPAIRLVRRQLVPEARDEHLAEVLFGGLVVQCASDLWTVPAGDELYDFRPGVRELLLSSVDAITIERVARSIGRYLERLHGASHNFFAALDPANDASRSAPASRPFATVSAALFNVVRPQWRGASPAAGTLRAIAHVRVFSASVTDPTYPIGESGLHIDVAGGGFDVEFDGANHAITQQLLAIEYPDDDDDNVYAADHTEKLERELQSLLDAHRPWHVRNSSSTPLFLNGKQIRPGTRVQLDDGAILRTGDTVMMFHQRPPASDDRVHSPEFPGPSQQAIAVRNRIDTMAASSRHLLILGELGTGHEIVADVLGARQRPRPYVAVDCRMLFGEAAHTELFGDIRDSSVATGSNKRGALELANHGILFLDHVEALPLTVQKKLRQFLQDGSYRPFLAIEPRRSRARVIAATTSIDIDLNVTNALRGHELLAQLCAGNPPLMLPGLHERCEDIVAWSHMFFRQLGRDPAYEPWTADALECLLLYPWPGNLRELLTVVRHAANKTSEFPCGTESLRAELVLHREQRRGDRLTPTSKASVAKGPETAERPSTADSRSSRLGSPVFRPGSPRTSTSTLAPASSNVTPSREAGAKLRILFLVTQANGKDRQRLADDYAAIERELQLAPHGNDFELISKWALTVDEMVRHLLDVDPTIVHLWGEAVDIKSDPAHLASDRDTGIYLLSEHRDPQPVTGRALTMMLGAAAPSARVVVLSGCYTDSLADELCQVVECVVGMAHDQDHAARSFATAFYRALGHRRSVGHAIEHAVAALAARELPDEYVPRCRTRNGRDPHKVLLTIDPRG